MIRVLQVLSEPIIHVLLFFPQASLERIGTDSKGNVYWYDGGKNMFLSPPSSDPAYKPRSVRGRKGRKWGENCWPAVELQEKWYISHKLF